MFASVELSPYGGAVELSPTLVRKWTPLEPLEVMPKRVEKMAQPLILAVAESFQPVPA